MLTLTSLRIWLHWEHAGSGGMLTLTTLTIWLCWEQAVSGGSGFARRGETSITSRGGSSFTGRGETGCPGSNLVVVNRASLEEGCDIKLMEQ
jgi:hypothetical protein